MATRRGMSLQEEIARKLGVQLPDGRIYRNGVITSAQDAANAANTRAITAVRSAQAGPRPLGGFAGDGEARAAAARLDPASNPNLRPLAPAQQLANLMALQPLSFGAPAGGGFGGGRDVSALSSASLGLARQTLTGNAGRVAGRDYSPAAIARATPEQIQLEASRLPKLMEAQATLGAAGALLPDRDYSPAALGRATPEQTIAEAGTLDTRVEAARRKRQQDIGAASVQGLQDVAFDPKAPAETRANQIDTLAQAAAQRVAKAGGSVQDIQAAAALVRQTLDPTGEINYQRQLNRDLAQQKARADLEDSRLDAKEKVRMDREDRAGLQYLRTSDELEQAQQGFLAATALTPAQEASVLKSALDAAEVGDGFLGIGNPRAKIKNANDARRMLAADPEALRRFDETYAQEQKGYQDINATQGPAIAAQRKVERALARVKALERRGISPTERSFQLYDAERGIKGGDQVLDAATGKPVSDGSARLGPVAAAPAVPGWMAALGVAPAAPAAPADSGQLTAQDIASIFPAPAPVAPAPRPVPTVSQALSAEGLLGLLSPSGQTTQAIAYNAAPAMQWLRNLFGGAGNYAASVNQQAADSLAALPAAAARLVAGDAGARAALNADQGIANILAEFSPAVLSTGASLRGVQGRIAAANRDRIAAARQLGLPDTVTWPQIQAARRSVIRNLQ